MSGGVMFQRGESYTYWCNECALVIAASLNTYNESSDGGVGDHRAAALIQAERERVEPMVITSDAPMTIRPLGEKT
jgi:hypothetical protein